MELKEALLKELSEVRCVNGMTIDDIKLNSDLGFKIVENTVKKLMLTDVSKSVKCKHSRWYKFANTIIGTICLKCRYNN